MTTAAELAGGERILRTVIDFVDEEIIRDVFGYGRAQLIAVYESGQAANLVEKGWQALIMDANLVSVPQSLLSVASRTQIASHLAVQLSRAPYYTSQSKKLTPLAHRITANAAVTRAAYYQFERASIDKVGRLADGVLRQLREGAEAQVTALVNHVDSLNPRLRERMLDRIARGETHVQDFTERMDDALRKWEQSFVASVTADAQQAQKFGVQRATDTLYHFEHARNPWGKGSHPLSAIELGNAVFTHRHQVLPISASRVLREARGLSRAIRQDMLDIITREVMLKGNNPKAAARIILQKYREELGERWGGAKVSAKRIARTEASYILNEATRISYEEMGVRFVDVIWSEGKWPCDVCPPIADGGPYPIDNIPEGGIPFHPNCRCTYVAAFPASGKELTEALSGLKTPPEVIGVKNWILELAKVGFVATAVRKLFGKKEPSKKEKEEASELIGEIEDVPDAEAPGIHRGDGTIVRGFRRIEPNRFPRPMTDRFREVLVRDPIRAVADLRKNAYEIGGIIRGNRLLYFKGDEGSVEIRPIIEASGGLAKGDILFHTHPGAMLGGLSTSVPSDADLRVHMWASTILGDGARHIIAGSDGLRELRVEIDDLAKWNTRLQENWYLIFFAFLIELFQGIRWWQTYGMRKALKTLEKLDLGGRLIISEPTTPGSEFIPLQPYVAAGRVSPVVIAELERMGAPQLRDLHARVADEQSIPQFRDRDYYVGLLRSLDPSRDWDEAAPTKRRAQELLRLEGSANTGTRFNKEEIISLLTGQPVFGKVYIDTQQVNYAALLGIPEERLTASIDEEYVRAAIENVSPDQIQEFFDHVVRVHGVPGERDYSMKVAQLEQMNPRGDYWGMPEPDIDAILKPLDKSKPAMPSMEEQEFYEVDELRQIKADQEYESWTDEQRRLILQGKPVHGVTLLPDLSAVWWGQWFPSLPEKAPEIVPVLAVETKAKAKAGRDAYRSPLLVTNRHEVIRDRWGIEMREGGRTDPWAFEDLMLLDYALHLLPEAARAIDTVSLYMTMETYYDRVLRRLIVGKDANLSVIVHTLAHILCVGVLRLGWYDDTTMFRSPVDRVSLLREWIGVEPWRYRVGTSLYHPHTADGVRAVLSGLGHWSSPGNNLSGATDPCDSLTSAIAMHVMEGTFKTEQGAFVRNLVFGGDRFRREDVTIAGRPKKLPVRYRTASKAALA